MPNIDNDAFYYPGSERPPLDGHEDENFKAVKGTYPYPQRVVDTSGDSAMTEDHPDFGGPR